MKVLFLILLLSFSALAQKITLNHSPISNLPAAGRAMLLAVNVVGSRSPELPIRALVFRDGVPLDVKLRAKTFDSGDRIVYSAMIPAPKREMSYTFALTRDDGIVKTESFKISRDCETSFALTEWNGTVAEPSREEGMVPVQKQSRSLERDIEQYEFLLKQVSALKEAFSK